MGIYRMRWLIALLVFGSIGVQCETYSTLDDNRLDDGALVSLPTNDENYLDYVTQLIDEYAPDAKVKADKAKLKKDEKVEEVGKKAAKKAQAKFVQKSGKVEKLKAEAKQKAAEAKKEKQTASKDEMT